MTLPEAHPLDYAPPPTLRQQLNPATWRTIAVMAAIAISSAALSLTGTRIIPGGPFISIHADLIPSLLCLGVIGFLWRPLRSAPALIRLCAAVIILGSATVIVFITDDVMTFWLFPYARGALFAF